MRIKSKALIEYFGTKNVNEKVIKNHGKFINISSSDYDINELLTLISTFKDSIESVILSNYYPEKTNETILSLPENVKIKLLGITIEAFRNLDNEATKKIDFVGFNELDQEIEMMDIGEITDKFQNASTIFYPFQVGQHNVSDMDQLVNLAKRCERISAEPQFLNEFKEYCNQKFDGQEGRKHINSVLYFGDRTIFAAELLNEKNNSDNSVFRCPSFRIPGENTYNYFKELSNYDGKTINIIAANITEIPLEVLQKLKDEGIKCKITIYSSDNSSFENCDYELDEYIEIYKQMQELVGDIDDNLPEEQKFRLIYERVTSFLVYDYPAAYPRNAREKEYSEANNINCRNLRNALLQGKTVCAGYADVLKNACLLKGIECEYVQGPVDSYLTMDSYIMKKNHSKEIVEKGKDYVIERDYHAWNKVKINGIWYNVDPTWSRDDVLKGIVPTFAFVSDEDLVKTGRPTSKRNRTPCDITMPREEKGRIFDPATKEGRVETEEIPKPVFRDLIAYNKVIEFEENVDKYGNPLQLPAPITNLRFKKFIVSLKILNYRIKNLIASWKKNNQIKASKKGEGKVEKTTPMETVEKTTPLPTIEEPANQTHNPWKLSDEYVKKVIETGANPTEPSSQKSMEDVSKGE